MSKTILIVEDNAIHAALIKDVLEVKGFSAVHVSNGQEAHALARDHRPGLIFMDIQLPGISGVDLTSAIKADDDLKDIPVIAVTAFASKKDEEKIRAAGCIEILTKPFSIPNLLETVARYLEDPAKPPS
jgi:two-component system, cell cycle response regulator DivK